MKALLLILSLLLGLHADTILPENNSSQSIAPVKSPNDKRDYSYFTLPNGMRVLTISDPQTDKAAAALAVGIGSMSNPEDRPGLAHFLEHMLFMGTNKYPDVEAYNRFITKNGGYTNAGTGQISTNYIFSVKPDKLEPALDRFAQFFVAPLLDPHFVEREKHAVDSEYRLKRKDDGRRLYAAIQRAYNPQSPYSRFSVGSLDTLEDRPGRKVRDELLKFYRSYYGAQLMGLVVLGRESLPQLRKMVETKFSAVPDNNASRYTPTPDNYALRSDELPARLDVVPINETRKLILVFPVPSAKKEFRVSPLYYLASLIRNRSEGSLYTMLQKKGWITEMSAGGDNLNDQEGQFNITMELTQEGSGQLPEIEAATYAYLNLIGKEGITRWRYEEQQKLDELGFRFAAKEPPFQYVSFLSGRLLDFPPKELLRGGRILQHFDEAVIRRYLKYLRPDNALTVVVDKKSRTDKVEVNYQVPYRVQKKAEQIADPEPFAGKLQLPGPNPFIPKNLDFVSEKELSTIPILLERKSGFALWHKHDISFGAPRTTVTIRLRSPAAAESAEHSVSLKLYLRLVNERLAALSDAASRAGIHYSIDTEAEGITLQLYGYSDTLPLFLDKLLEAMGERQIDPERFGVQKAQLDRDLANQRQSYAFNQVIGALFRSLITPSWSPEEERGALGAVDPKTMQSYLQKFYDKIDLTILDIGNTDKKRSLQLAKAVREKLLGKSRLESLPDPRVDIPKIGQIKRVDYPVKHPDSVLIEVDTEEPVKAAISARWQLLAQLINQPFSTELRTKQQLGYVVLSQFLEEQRYPVLLLIVQSSRVGVPELEKRFAAFRKSFLPMLQQIGEKDFEANKAGLIATLLHRDETLLQRSERYWGAIVNDRLDFDFRKRVAAAVKNIGKEEMLSFYREKILQKPRRVLGFSNGTKF